MTWTVGVDVGGTFTDFYARNEASGEVHIGKCSSTPDDPSCAIVDGLKELSQRRAIELEGVERVLHGTTAGTNALIQRRGAKVALVTTKGFRDLLEIGRQTRPHMYDLHADHPPSLVPRDRCFEVAERVSSEGDVLHPVLRESLGDIATAVRDSGADACAVCFLFAFLNPDHEEMLAKHLQDALPGIHLSLSSAVRPEFREYERFSTTVLNAYLQPVLTDYIRNLERSLSELTPSASVGINQSSGGIMSPAHASRFPVRTALSGPAAGAVGAAHVSRSADRPNVITLDMGGTSADVALIRDYQVDLSFNREVAGFPIRLPAVDIETVGAGGGSVAWFDRDGLLKVGPLSAGADPGPACYGRGGQQPTVTDANLVLGRLSPSGLLGGEMALDVALAREAYAPVARSLGFPIERTAHGVLGIVVANMVRTIRTISVERGHDPRGFALMPFGGAGPLHARDVAVSLGIREILVPPTPGIVCAQGLVVSDLKEDFVISRRTSVDADHRDVMCGYVDALLMQARTWFARESVPRDRRMLEVSFDVRYVGQNFELTVPLGAGPELTADVVPEGSRLHQRFLAVHEAAYGYCNVEDPIEVVNYRLTARAVFGEPDTFVPSRTCTGSPEPDAQRPVYFCPDEAMPSAIYRRGELEPGHVIVGPAIIEQLDATTPIYPDDRATVDAAGNLLITIPELP